MSYGVNGAYGLRDNVRTYKDLVEDASWAKVVLAELYPGEPVTSWANVSGDVYVGAARRRHDGVRLDIMGVDTLLGRLTRSTVSDPTTLAAGEYWYNVDADVADISWDDNVTRYDDGTSHWDEFVAVYVRLPDGSNPENTEVEVEYFLAFASRAETHPVLGTNRVSNGSFETYSTPGVPGGTFTGWTYAANAAAGGTVTIEEDAEPYLGDAAARITLENVPFRGGSIYQDMGAVVAGQSYRVSGAYKVTGAARAMVSVRDDAAAWYADTTGREASSGALADVSLTETPDGEWRRFTWDFVAPAAGTLRVYLLAYAYNNGAASGEVPAMGNGSVSWDDIQARPIHRMAHYAPRITAANVPTISTASNDVFFGGKQIGVGGVAFLNHDAFFETLSTLDWVNRRCVLKVGGAYLADDGGDPEPIPVDEYRTAFTGLVQNVKVDDVEFALDIQDIRAAYFRSVPTRAYTVADFPNAAPADEGRPRALWFGRKTHVRPIRYASGATYGLYELADCTDAPNGITELAQVWSYVDKTAADSRDNTRRMLLDFKRQADLDFTGADFSGVTINDAEQTAFKIAGAAWDSGIWFDQAQDAVESTDVVRFEGTAGATQNLMIGFSDQAPSTYAYTELDFAIYIPPAGNTYGIYESGALKHTYTQTCHVGDRHRVLMNSGAVEYWLNSVDTDGWELMYTSLVEPSGTYQPAVAFSATNGYLTGVALYREGSLHYTPTLSTGRFTLDANVKALEVTHENKRISFNDGGTEKTAILQPGIYTPDEAVFQITAAIAAVAFKTGVANLYTYSTSTHRFTLASGATLGFNFSSGEFTDLWKALGFTQEDSTITDTSDVAEGPAYVSDDEDVILRADGQGYKDDGAGTYTSVADGLIEVGADVLRTLLVAFLHNPPSIIDEASFESARERAPESVAVHMNREWKLKDIMETLEWTNVANIAIGGDGTVYYDVYTGTVATGTVTLKDTDFSAFAVTWEAADVYATVRSFYDEDPEGNFYLYRATENPDVEARFGRPEVKEFFTWLTFATAAANNAARMSELAKTPAQQLRGTVRGKLLDYRVGQKVRVTRNRAAASGGLLSSSVYRIISIRQNHAMGLSQFIAVPDVVTVAGVACITECQSYCETSCQSACEGTCQTECQTTCEAGCEVACQSCEQTTCQDTCELECQTTCQTSCQSGCQLGCETGCEVACQTSCQLGCQSTCQVSCQTTCELTCQTTCELTCQTACEVGCQTSCQHACQFKCEWWCQVGQSEVI